MTNEREQELLEIISKYEELFCRHNLTNYCNCSLCDKYRRASREYQTNLSIKEHRE